MTHRHYCVSHVEPLFVILFSVFSSSTPQTISLHCLSPDQCINSSVYDECSSFKKKNHHFFPPSGVRDLKLKQNLPSFLSTFLCSFELPSLPNSRYQVFYSVPFTHLSTLVLGSHHFNNYAIFKMFWHSGMKITRDVLPVPCGSFHFFNVIEKQGPFFNN